MCPDHVGVRPIDEEQDEVVLQLQHTLRGPVHNPPIPESLIDTLSPSSYASPLPEVFPSLAIGSPGMWTAADDSLDDAIFPYMVNDAGEHLHISQYSDCKADTGVDQINGFVFVCDAGVKELQSPQGRYLYKDCKKYGSGAQVNGVEIVVNGSIRKAPAPPSLPGRWEGVNLLGAEGRGSKGGYKSQINGGRIRPMMRSEMGVESGSVH
ncbi:hypothetical protein ACQKWADRAFT_285829 [Trichoderma austrokoningii]